jgi:large-conductance mechanosensitive channel
MNIETDSSTPIPTVPASVNSRIIVDFAGFLKDQNILGLAVSFLIAQSVMDMTRSISGSGIMPIVRSIRTLRPPQFDGNNLLETAITFTIVMFIAFIIIRYARVKTQAVPIVQVLGR